MKRIVSKEHIFNYMNTCESHFGACLSKTSMCEESATDKVMSSHLPCLRACNNCLERGEQCVRWVFLMLTADCEEGNKEDASIDPELRLLSMIPEVPHVGKNLKAGFSNWYLKLGKGRLNLAVIRSLRNRSTENFKQAVRKLVP